MYHRFHWTSCCAHRLFLAVHPARPSTREHCNPEERAHASMYSTCHNYTGGDQIRRKSLGTPRVTRKWDEQFWRMEMVDMVITKMWFSWRKSRSANYSLRFCVCWVWGNLHIKNRHIISGKQAQESYADLYMPPKASELRMYFIFGNFNLNVVSM